MELRIKTLQVSKMNLALFFLILIVSYLGLNLIFHGLDWQEFFFFMTLMLVLILIKPVWGILSYLGLFLLLPSSGNVTSHELFMLGILIMLCFYWFLSRAKGGVLLIGNRIERILLILFLYCGFSLFIALRNGISFTDFGRDLFPLLNLILILPVSYFVKTERDLKIVFGLFILVMTLGMFQWFWSLLAEVRITSYSPKFWYHTSVLMVPTLIVLGVTSYLEYHKFKFLYLLPMVFSLGVAIFTSTRTIWLGVIISFVLLFFLLIKHKKRLITSVILIIMIGTIFLGSVVSKQRQSFITDQIERAQTIHTLNTDRSFQGRKEESIQTMKLFFSSPLFGVGVGYKYRFVRSLVPGVGATHLVTNFTHSDFTNYLAKTGIIGILILIVLFYQVIVLSRRFYKQSQNRFNKIIYLTTQIGTIMALFVGNLTPVLQHRPSTFFLAFLISFMLIGRKLELGVKSKNASRPS